ncbi:hypothetical protein QJS66_20085 [Kocuria rhizophila]|nr:hypothetical protein QJS66_20085 [Kocuria rhizophila]
MRGEVKYRLESALASVTGVLAAVAASGWIAFSTVAHGRVSRVARRGRCGRPVDRDPRGGGCRVISAAGAGAAGMITLGVTPVALLGDGGFTGQVLAAVVA